MNQDLRNRVAESIIVVAVLVAAWFVLAQPFRERAEKAESRVRALRAELEGYKASIDLPPEQSKVYMTRVGRLIELAGPRSTLAEHDRILSLARESGLDVGRINPAPDASPSRVGPIVTGSRRFQIETGGTFAQLSAYLSALSTRAPMSVVDHFAISVADAADPEALALSASVKVGRMSTHRVDLAEVRP